MQYNSINTIAVELRTALEDRERMKEVEEAIGREVERNVAAVQAKNVQVRQLFPFICLFSSV